MSVSSSVKSVTWRPSSATRIDNTGCACGGGCSMDPLSLLGLFAVAAMLLCYAVEDRSPWFVLCFAGACVLGSVYGFLQGAWPFGLVEAVWSLVAVRRWWLTSSVKIDGSQVTKAQVLRNAGSED